MIFLNPEYAEGRVNFELGVQPSRRSGVPQGDRMLKISFVVWRLVRL